ncbi:MAG: hypothetical protein AAF468_00315 [Pseudomonadota bacterium]
MSFVDSTVRLTHHAALAMLKAACDKAEDLGQLQCIVIVDPSGETPSRLTFDIFCDPICIIGKAFVLSSHHLLLNSNDEPKSLPYPIKPICP